MYLLIYSFMHLCYKSYDPKDFLGQITNELLHDKHSYLPYIWKPRRLSCVAQCHFGISQNQTTQGHLSWLFIWCGFSKLNPYQILFHCNHLNQLFTLAEYDTLRNSCLGLSSLSIKFKVLEDRLCVLYIMYLSLHF